MAAIIRGVISALGILSLLCTLATTRSSRFSNDGFWSSDPSSRMSTSMPVRIRNGLRSPADASDAYRSLSAATTSSCCSKRSADSPFATVSRGE